MRLPIAYSSVRKPRWINSQQIHCLVCFDHLPDKEVPFVADPTDVEPHGREIFERAKNGDFGSLGRVPSEEIAEWPQVTFDPVPAWPELQDILARVNLENIAPTEAGTVVTWAAVLEDLLKQVITKTGSNARSSFASHIDRAFECGLISDQQQHCLHLLREIRNDFAHNALASLSSQDSSEKLAKAYEIACEDEWQAPEPKMLYATVAATLAVHLHSLR